MAKKRRDKKKKNENEVEFMTEEEFFGFEFIAGYTSGGVPFGITKEEAEEMEKENKNRPNDADDDMPF